MTTPTFNKFKSTTIYGAFNNLDYEDNSIQASSNIQRNLTVGGDIIVATGNIKGKKLYYDDVDIASTFVSNTSLTTTLNPYALLSGATFYGTLIALTPVTSDVSTKVATTAFVNTKLSATLTSYANLSGATFTGNVSGLTASTSDNSTKFATTAFVKAQNYITSNPDLSPYALLSGATFTGTVNCNNGLTTLAGKDVHISCNNTFPTTNSGGKQGLGFFWNKSGGVGEVNLLCYGQGGTGGLNIWNSNVSNVPTKLVEFFPSGSVFSTTVDGITPATSDNSTKFATTAYVKAQNYALLSGATFTGALNATTQATSNNSTLVATTAYVKAQNYITSSALSPYALSSSLSSYALSSTLNNYALLSGATFTGTVNCNNGLLNISQPSSTQSPILQFRNDVGQARALIYPSVSDAVLRFSILPNYGTNGFEWEKNGTILMSLDLNGNLSISGNLTTNTSSTIPAYSTITVPTTNTHDNYQGNYYTTYSVRPTNSVNTLNGVSTVNIGIPFIGGNTQFPNFNPITISSVYFALGSLANPDTPQNSVYCVISPSYGATPTNTTNFFTINMYNVNGTRVRGYGTLLKSYSTNSYSIIFVATDGVGFALNTSYYYDPFQFTYT